MGNWAPPFAKQLAKACSSLSANSCLCVNPSRVLAAQAVPQRLSADCGRAVKLVYLP